MNQNDRKPVAWADAHAEDDQPLADRGLKPVNVRTMPAVAQSAGPLRLNPPQATARIPSSPARSPARFTAERPLLLFLQFNRWTHRGGLTTLYTSNPESPRNG